jgi:hypothetical protein
VAKINIRSAIKSVTDALSNMFFFLGLITSKLRLLPIPVVSPVCNILSLIFYGLAYGLSWVSSLLTPHGTEEKKKFKILLVIASLTGLLATVLCAMSLIFPVLLIPSLWLYCIANSVWTVSEIIKIYYKELQTEDYDAVKQPKYINYAITVSLIAFIAAFVATLAAIFPTISLPLLVISSFICVALSILAIQLYVSSVIAYKKDLSDSQKINSKSSKKITDLLGKNLINHDKDNNNIDNFENLLIIESYYDDADEENNSRKQETEETEETGLNNSFDYKLPPMYS